MKSRSKSIKLVDQQIEVNLIRSLNLGKSTSDIIFLDPVQLFLEIDWTQFEEDVQVINKVYSKLFDEVIISNKQLICFWPLAEYYGSDWFELDALCKSNSYELEVYKGEFLKEDNYGFSEEILRCWKKFVYFLIETLLEDIQSNEEFEEIATLTTDQDGIFLFKLGQAGKVCYSFAFDSQHMALVQDQKVSDASNDIPQLFFESFQEMLEKLVQEIDLSSYRTKFSDPHLEKAYFNVLAKEFRSKNLIETWIKFYSLN